MGGVEDAKRHARLVSISARWRAIERLRAFANLPASRREAVFSELEDLARDAGEERRGDLLVAADALESLVSVLDTFGVHFAAEDVETLLELAEKRGP